MAQKTAAAKKSARQTRDEHELLQQDDFHWLADFRNVLSPYWSSRVEFHPEKNGPVLVLENTRTAHR